MARLEFSCLTAAPLHDEEFARYGHGQDGLFHFLRAQLHDVVIGIPFDRVALHFDIEPNGADHQLNLRDLGPTSHKGESLFWAECTVTNRNFFDLSVEDRWRTLSTLVAQYFRALVGCLQRKGELSAEKLGEVLLEAVNDFVAQKEVDGFPEPRKTDRRDFNPLFVGLRLMHKLKGFLAGPNRRPRFPRLK
jgi:hypothetical protein